MDFSWAWWYRPVIPTLRRLRQESYEFQTCLKSNLVNKILSRKNVF
jgi:hypothetical protein